jgi:hypothetical protein
MSVTYEIALEKYKRLCAKSESEWRRGGSKLSPFLEAMSCGYNFSQPFPSLSGLRELAEQDREDIVLLLHYLGSCSSVPADFRREFDRIDV